MSSSGFRLSHSTMCVHENGKECDGVESVFSWWLGPERENFNLRMNAPSWLSWDLFTLPSPTLLPLFACLFRESLQPRAKEFLRFLRPFEMGKILLVSYFPRGNKIFRSTYFWAHQGEEAARKIPRQGSYAVVENWKTESIWPQT